MDGVLLLEKKYCILDIKFKTFLVSKSIPTAKFCQNFANILSGKKPTWENFLEFIFFYLKSQDYIDIIRTKIKLVSHHLHT